MSNNPIWDEEVAKWKLMWREREAELADRHRLERNALRDQKRLDWNRMREVIFQRQRDQQKQLDRLGRLWEKNKVDGDSGSSEEY